MSSSATIARSSGSSVEGRRPAIDLSAVTHPITSSPTIRLTGAACLPSASMHGESFIMNEKFIYSTATTPAAATYHLSTRNTQSGRPWQLQISHLLPSETRRLAIATSSQATLPFIRYDEDLTLYTGERLSVPFAIGQRPLLCIRGRGKGTLPGTVVVEKTLGKSRLYRFWHMTPRRRPLTVVEEERMQALMHRRGYRDSDDWNKELLYTAQGKGSKEMAEVEWMDERGVVVAMERDGQLVMIGEGEEEQDRRDLLVACWASKNFVQSIPETE